MTSALSNVFGSVLVRLALIYGALTAMTAAAIVIGWVVFQTIAGNMQTLAEVYLTDLQKSGDVVTVSERAHVLLTDTLIALDRATLSSLANKKNLVVQDMRSAAESFDDERTEELNGMIDVVDSALNDLNASRQASFAASNSVMAVVENAMQQATQARNELANRADSAYFNLVLGTDETISSIGETLTTLIEADFALFQTVLETRAEMNLLSGLALNSAQTRDAAMLSILRDLAAASTDGITKRLPALEANAATSELASLIADASGSFSDSVGGIGPRMAANDVLALRQKVDAVLASALDDIYFDLVIKSDDAKTGNEASIRALMDTEVNNIRQQAALDSATKAFFAATLQTALARNPTELGVRGDELRQAAATLRDALAPADEAIADMVAPLLALAEADTGIQSIRQASFTADAQANEATHRAADAVHDISILTGTIATVAKENIYDSAAALKADVAAARERMQQIGVISIAMAIMAPYLIWKMITAPLNHVTRVTERLANGDLSEITGLDRKTGEIGRMANALQVFRTGALDRLQLQQEEKKREIAQREAERAAEKAQQQAEAEARAEKEARAAEERKRDALAQQEKEAAREAAEAERQARAAEQEAVVSELAASLKRLSEGDFTYRIDQEFPAGYETLRRDYNAAISTLGELVRAISKSAGLIDTSSAEIAASSLDLSKRTENTAATLEQTAAALSELTASVSSAARGANTASDTVSAVKQGAESSKHVMNDAVAAMGQIEQSAAKIEKIVEVIDSISFQTNLLALNAGVEAARAGEAGRGFAVVASEVRILAHRCSEAALQISDLITESAKHVDNGVSMIDQTNKALETILEGITDVSQNVSEIAMSANEQSSGIAEINTAVEQLDRSTQQNAARFEETTAASQTLTTEASGLARLVAGFVVPDGTRDPQTNWEMPPETVDKLG